MCAGISCLVKLQAGGTTSASNRWYNCILYYIARNKIKGFCTIYVFCFYSWLESPVLVCIAAISYLILGVLVMICEKTSKPNKTRLFFKTFYEKIAFFKYHRFTHSLNYIIAMKHFVIFLFMLQCIHYTRFDWFYYFRKLFSQLVFLKEIVFLLLFLSAMSERQKREHYQWKLKVCSLNLKKTIYEIQFNRYVVF